MPLPIWFYYYDCAQNESPSNWITSKWKIFNLHRKSVIGYTPYESHIKYIQCLLEKPDNAHDLCTNHTIANWIIEKCHNVTKYVFTSNVMMGEVRNWKMCFSSFALSLSFNSIENGTSYVTYVICMYQRSDYFRVNKDKRDECVCVCVCGKCSQQ